MFVIVVVFIFSLFTASSTNSGNDGCLDWYDNCDGTHTCGTPDEYQHFIDTQDTFCIYNIPEYLSPVSGDCMNTSNGCQFVNPCVTWNKGCNGLDYQCTSQDEYDEYLLTDEADCIPFGKVPPPDKQCLLINNTCQWYSPCMKWPGHCNTGYICGDEVDYYKFTHGPQPLCVSYPYPPPPPSGECIYQQGNCTWSDCHSWLVCLSYWICGTEYDYKAYQLLPPTPCANPGEGHIPPSEPGMCIYNVEAGECHYNETNSIKPTGCSTVECPIGYTCEIYPSTEEGYCNPSCDLDNGGCDEDEVCTLVPVQCIRAPCPPVINCEATTGCSTVECPIGYTCEIYPSTGEGYCNPSCDLDNGGCDEDEVCTLVPVQCIRAPCPPVINCESEGCSLIDCDVYARCVVSGGDGLCLPSCFMSNGGCDVDEICTIEIVDECDKEYCSYIKCNEDIKNGDCPIGQVYMNGPATVLSCDNLHPEITLPAFYLGCFCTSGLVKYRDRCVDPLECPALLKHPPPFDPLPVEDDTVLIKLYISDITLYQFNQNKSYFISDIVDVLERNGVSSPVVSLYDAINDSDLIIVVVKITSDSLISNMNDENIVDIIETEKNNIRMKITTTSVLTSQYQNNDDDDDDDGDGLNIFAIVFSTVIMIIAVAIITVIIVIITLVVIRVTKKRRATTCVPTKHGLDNMGVTYTTLQSDIIDVDKMEVENPSD